MSQILAIFQPIFNDSPQPWQIGFQDSAAPAFTGIVELHNTIFFYLILICVSVFWLLGAIMYYYNDKKNVIIHKYLNHGTLMCLHIYKHSLKLAIVQGFLSSKDKYNLNSKFKKILAKLNIFYIEIKLNISKFIVLFSLIPTFISVKFIFKDINKTEYNHSFFLFIIFKFPGCSCTC